MVNNVSLGQYGKQMKEQSNDLDNNKLSELKTAVQKISNGASSLSRIYYTISLVQARLACAGYNPQTGEVDSSQTCPNITKAMYKQATLIETDEPITFTYLLDRESGSTSILSKSYTNVKNFNENADPNTVLESFRNNQTIINKTLEGINVNDITKVYNLTYPIIGFVKALGSVVGYIPTFDSSMSDSPNPFTDAVNTAASEMKRIKVYLTLVASLLASSFIVLMVFYSLELVCSLGPWTYKCCPDVCGARGWCLCCCQYCETVYFTWFGLVFLVLLVLAFPLREVNKFIYENELSDMLADLVDGFVTDEYLGKYISLIEGKIPDELKEPLHNILSQFKPKHFGDLVRVYLGMETKNNALINLFESEHFTVDTLVGFLYPKREELEKDGVILGETLTDIIDSAKDLISCAVGLLLSPVLSIFKPSTFHRLYFGVLDVLFLHVASVLALLAFVTYFTYVCLIPRLCLLGCGRDCWTYARLNARQKINVEDFDMPVNPNVVLVNGQLASGYPPQFVQYPPQAYGMPYPQMGGYPMGMVTENGEYVNMQSSQPMQYYSQYGTPDTTNPQQAVEMQPMNAYGDQNQMQPYSNVMNGNML